MTEFVKSIDEKHLLTVGLEGFYGPTNPPEKLIVNLGEWFLEAELAENFVEYISKWVTSLTVKMRIES